MKATSSVYAVVLRRGRNIINDIEIFTHDRERNGKGCALAKHLASYYGDSRDTSSVV